MGGNTKYRFKLISDPKTAMIFPPSRVLAENLVALGFLQSVSEIKSMPTHEKLFAVGKKCGPNAHFLTSFFFLGSGWPWVEEFVGFTITLNTFSNPTELGRLQTP